MRLKSLFLFIVTSLKFLAIFSSAVRLARAFLPLYCGPAHPSLSDLTGPAHPSLSDLTGPAHPPLSDLTGPAHPSLSDFTGPAHPSLSDLTGPAHHLYLTSLVTNFARS
ncbi:latent membrane protein 1 [Plakobranchus ocellatus]|uniref:Latent membrane protein 1 n=1 Tax=Plakobranchus ocellatus TaxID=259542 RepID=A0AAV3ZCJ5_9GAST|nr:latent membrane protein 1 [Plakobranchus ocellatus]